MIGRRCPSPLSKKIQRKWEKDEAANIEKGHENWPAILKGR